MTKIILALLCVLAFAVPSGARDAGQVTEDIIVSYQPWHSAEFSGKLRSDRLPLSPTVKMYMVRDSLLQISVRAPLIGEVGRLSVTRDEFLAVNKMKRVYCLEPAESLFDIWPTLLSDLQCLFLARVAILGSGELDADNEAIVEIGEDGEGNWLLLPRTDSGALPFNYGYIVGPGLRTNAMMAAVPGKGSLAIEYAYRDRGEQMKITLDRNGGRSFEAELDFSTVRWGGSAMTPVRLGGYTKVGLKEFIGSLSK